MREKGGGVRVAAYIPRFSFILVSFPSGPMLSLVRCGRNRRCRDLHRVELQICHISFLMLGRED
jgi:hypothetical protein